jgi:dipeptide transport system substrate-binding protein
VRLAKLKAGECHHIAYPPPAEIEALKKDKSVSVIQAPGLNIGYLSMQTTKKPFDDVRVRRAINMAIDKKAIVSAVYQGAGQVAVNPIPPILWSYNKTIKDYEYNPDAAKKLLAEAGVPDGFETDLWAIPVQRPYNPNGRRVAELMQSDLAKIGIKAKIVSYEWGEYRKRLAAGEHQLALYGWTGDNGDPDNFLAVLLGCVDGKPGNSNSAKWCDPKFNELMTKAKVISNQAERAKLYEEAQVIFHAQVPWMPLAHSVVTEVSRPDVVGYKQSPLGTHQFQNVSLK